MNYIEEERVGVIFQEGDFNSMDYDKVNYRIESRGGASMWITVNNERLYLDAVTIAFLDKVNSAAILVDMRHPKSRVKRFQNYLTRIMPV